MLTYQLLPSEFSKCPKVKCGSVQFFVMGHGSYMCIDCNSHIAIRCNICGELFVKHEKWVRGSQCPDGHEQLGFMTISVEKIDDLG